jgi:hypothetical protein
MENDINTTLRKASGTIKEFLEEHKKEMEKKKEMLEKLKALC